MIYTYDDYSDFSKYDNRVDIGTSYKCYKTLNPFIEDKDLFLSWNICSKESLIFVEPFHICYFYGSMTRALVSDGTMDICGNVWDRDEDFRKYVCSNHYGQSLYNGILNSDKIFKDLKNVCKLACFEDLYGTSYSNVRDGLYFNNHINGYAETDHDLSKHGYLQDNIIRRIVVDKDLVFNDEYKTRVFNV